METRPLIRWMGGLTVAVLILLAYSLAGAQMTERKTLELRMGGSDLVNTSFPFKRVSIADPSVADVNVLSPKELYVYGKKVGYTSIILWQEGKSATNKTLLDVVVSLDLTALKEKIHQLYPNQEINVYSSETGVVLSGTVSGPEIVDQVIRLTETYLPKKAEGPKGSKGSGQSGVGLTNLLKVKGIQQVMLDVQVAEVDRNWNKDWQAAVGIGGLDKDFTVISGVNGVSQFFGSELISPGNIGTPLGLGSLLINFAGLQGNGNSPANIFINIDKFTAALRFLQTEGLARVLAEPRLVTMSGQEASFLAGGEFPIPVAQPGGSGSSAITIEFKEFGVALRFTPVVLSDGRISLRVAPSVSDITSSSVIPAGIQGANFVVPNLSIRKLETSVELYDGQTLALAGLLQDNLRESVQKVPGLGDIPILGPLFRSTAYQHDKTDLLIAVTPHLVKPQPEGSLRYPGEFVQPPNWYEFWLEGRLEGRRHGTGNEPQSIMPMASGGESGGMEGTFGFQPVTQSN